MGSEFLEPVQCSVLDDLGSPLIASPTRKRYPGPATPFHDFLPLDPLTRAESYDNVPVSGQKRDCAHDYARERVSLFTLSIETSQARAGWSLNVSDAIAVGVTT